MSTSPASVQTSLIGLRLQTSLLCRHGGKACRWSCSRPWRWAEASSRPMSRVKESLPQGYGGIVPTEDASDLAAAVVERLIDPKLRVVEERTVRRLVERNHDLRRTLASVGSVYLEVLEDGPK